MFETERFIIRPYTIKDAENLLHTIGTYEVYITTYGIPHPCDLKYAKKWIKGVINNAVKDKSYEYAITGKEDGQYLGNVGLINIDIASRKCDISYFVNPEYWGCTNNLYPVALYTIRSPHEAENVFHYYDNMGREIFYMTEYDPDQQYNITKTKKAYKAKWKKVKKKVKVKKTKKVKKKVKWKKVKTKKGKYKWKYKKKKVKVTYYKWKKKKVWLYKTKYKTVTTKTPTYKDRKDYVYYLGIL